MLDLAPSAGFCPDPAPAGFIATVPPCPTPFRGARSRHGSSCHATSHLPAQPPSRGNSGTERTPPITSEGPEWVVHVVELGWGRTRPRRPFRLRLRGLLNVHPTAGDSARSSEKNSDAAEEAVL